MDVDNEISPESNNDRSRNLSEITPEFSLKENNDSPHDSDEGGKFMIEKDNDSEIAEIGDLEVVGDESEQSDFTASEELDGAELKDENIKASDSDETSQSVTYRNEREINMQPEIENDLVTLEIAEVSISEPNQHPGDTAQLDDAYDQPDSLNSFAAAEDTIEQASLEDPTESENSEERDGSNSLPADVDDDDDFGDFDDHNDEQFNEDDEDGFGDFDDAAAVITLNIPSATPSTVPCLHEADFSNSIDLQASILSMLKPLSDHDVPSPRQSLPDDEISATASSSSCGSAYFSERSYSLWKQLALISSQLHPVDWKRSSIRRLLLISLGIPLDLDQVLPRKDTKRLILPSISTSKDHKGASKSPNPSSDDKSPTDSKHEELVVQTETNVAQWRSMANISIEALNNMSEEEVSLHISNLNQALTEAQALCIQWQQKKDLAIQDKETFEGVIESLLEYAQRLRRKR